MTEDVFCEMHLENLVLGKENVKSVENDFSFMHMSCIATSEIYLL